MMRRLAAHFALAAIWLGSLSPLVYTAQISNLPACCRRSGLHHCQAPASESSSNVEFRSTAAGCPFSAPLTVTSFAGLETSKFTVASPKIARFVVRQTSLSGFLSSVSVLPARGPPVLL